MSEMIGILRGFERTLNARADDFPFEIVSSIRRFIIRTHTIDEGKLLFAFDFNEVATNAESVQFLIDTSNDLDRYGIEGFVEFDRPAYGFIGRKFMEQGIENADYQRVMDEIVFASFQ